MKVVLVTIVLTSALVWSQSAKEPGYPSRHASVGKKYSGASSVPAPKTEPLAAQLAKIESQGAHVPSSSANNHSAASAKPVFPKTTATSQNKNRPMKFTPKAQPTRSGQPH
jgi:hypothetical protein